MCGRSGPESEHAAGGGSPDAAGESIIPYRIAIAPDHAKLEDPSDNSSSWHWTRLLEAAGHEVRSVDPFSSGILEQLSGCDGFMWRHRHDPRDRAVAHRLLPVVEGHLGLAVYPDQRTCWHYDDKIRQAYLFQALGIPATPTWVFWKKDEALQFVAGAEYPLVIKFESGASSTNVGLLKNAAEAEWIVKRLFGPGARSLEADFGELRLTWKQRLRAAGRILTTGRHPDLAQPLELRQGRIYLQTFLKGNDFEQRIVVIGRRAFARRRLNGPNDFRASGYGLGDRDPSKIDPRAVRLAYDVARKLDTQCLAVDMLQKDGEPVVSEVTYAFHSRKLQMHPGHWVLEGEPERGSLRWVEGNLWPEEAQIEDFLKRLDARRESKEGSKGEPAAATMRAVE